MNLKFAIIPLCIFLSGCSETRNWTDVSVIKSDKDKLFVHLKHRYSKIGESGSSTEVATYIYQDDDWKFSSSSINKSEYQYQPSENGKLKGIILYNGEHDWSGKNLHIAIPIPHHEPNDVEKYEIMKFKVDLSTPNKSVQENGSH